MDETNIDFSRGDDDIVFIQPEIDMEEISESENPEKRLEDKMSERELEWENCQLLGLFEEEFALMMDEDAALYLEGENIGPKDLQE